MKGASQAKFQTAQSIANRVLFTNFGSINPNVVKAKARDAKRVSAKAAAMDALMGALAARRRTKRLHKQRLQRAARRTTRLHRKR